MSFHIQFNVSAYKVASPLIKKPEEDLRFKDVCVCVLGGGGEFGKLCIPFCTKILAMPLCFIAEGYFKCLLSYLRRELILYCIVNG